MACTTMLGCVHYYIRLLGIDRFTLNRILPIPILTDSDDCNLTDTDFEN